MKSINFINPVPPQKQKELAYWLYGSIALLMALVTGLMVLHYKGTRHCQLLLREVHQLRELVSQTQPLAAKRDNLARMKQTLDQHLQLTTRQRAQGQIPEQLLTQLARIIPTSCCLTKLEALPNGVLQISGIGHHAKAVATFLDLLSACQQIDDPRLASLSPAKKHTSFAIVATWHTTKSDNEPWASFSA
jgi:Tfp pilus assembly protein PilN